MTKRYAQYNAKSGRALVYEADGSEFMIEIKLDGTFDGPSSVPERFFTGMWVQPAMCERVEEIGELPEYGSLKRLMRFNKDREALVCFFATAIDGQCDRETRKMAGEALENALVVAVPDALEQFCKIVVETPFPEGASTRDAPLQTRGSQILAQAVARYGHMTPTWVN